MYPYTGERRDVLGNTSPEDQEILKDGVLVEGRGVQNPDPREITSTK